MLQQCAAPPAMIRFAPLSRSSTRAAAAQLKQVRPLNKSASRSGVAVRASEEAAGGEGDDFEDRLSSLRGKRSKRAPVSAEQKAAKEAGSAPEKKTTSPPKGQKRRGVRDFTVVGTVDEPEGIDWGPETIKYEGPPARGEVVANLAMSWTVVGLCNLECS